MNLRNNFSTSFICIILIFLISFPLQSKSRETKVIIELLNDNSYSGVLFEVTQDEVIIYENEKVRKIEISQIKNVGIKRDSTFLTSAFRGTLIGGAFGGALALSTKAEKEGLVPTEEGQFLLSVIGMAFYGFLFGSLFSLSISKYKNYKFSGYSDLKKIKFLKKLKRKARI